MLLTFPRSGLPHTGKNLSIGESSAREQTVAGAVLGRALTILGGLSRLAERLALLAGLGGLAIWLLVFREAGNEGTAVLVVVALLLLAPPAVLVLFVIGVRGLMALPGRLRDTPAAVGTRGNEIRRRTADLGASRRRGFLPTIGALFRLSWAVTSSREVMQLAPVLLRPWLVIASVAAAVGALLEILVGAVALIVLLVG
ncbi:MAG: hypothetical protein ACRDHB_07120 [Actinomycetota bacterium]